MSEGLKDGGKVIGSMGAVVAPVVPPLGALWAGIGGITYLTGAATGAFGMDEAEPDAAEFTTGQQGDLLTGITTNDENVGGMYNRVTGTGGTLITESSYNGVKVSDQLANFDEQQNAQFDAVTGYALNNDDAASFDWFQTHHDDGIMDGYSEAFVDGPIHLSTLTEIREFLLGQAITFDEPAMDGLVADGRINNIDWTTWCFEQQGPCKPLDAMALNEPQNNNVF